jgi:hypothetical protein
MLFGLVPLELLLLPSVACQTNLKWLSGKEYLKIEKKRVGEDNQASHIVTMKSIMWTIGI